MFYLKPLFLDFISCSIYIESLRADFTSKLVRELAFGTPKFYIAPYERINHGLVNMSFNCDVKSGLRLVLFDNYFVCYR